MVCDDALECSVDTCDELLGCQYDLSGCECETAAECDDLNVCTDDACVDLMCENTPIPDCCNVDAECDDADICTDDACVANECAFTGVGPQGCYDGPAGTAGVGICKAGTQTCSDDSWGDCVGQVLPGSEVCDDKLDNDCDGRTDEGCREPPDRDEPTPPEEPALTPTPTVVVEVLGVEDLPETGIAPIAPALPVLPMTLSALALIAGGLVLRGTEED